MSALVTSRPVTSTWNIDPVHSIAEFKVKHMMISNVKGQFTAIQGSLALDEKDIANSRVEVSIEAASISTRDTQRDAHLKSADFFDVDKFPTLSLEVDAHEPTKPRRNWLWRATLQFTVSSGTWRLLWRDRLRRPRILGAIPA